jgi:prophage tail gpP-like protein
MEPTREHRVAIEIAGKRIDGWSEYEIDTSMVQPADSFKLVRPFDADAFRLCEPDASVQIKIDDTPILNGFIDERRKSSRDGSISISGKDKVGRLVNESVPAMSLDGLEMSQVVAKVAERWFSKVTLDGARDRAVRTGKRGHKAPAGKEPVVIKTLLRKRRTEPGQMRWAVIEEVLSQLGYCAWASGDGRELVIAPPNYNQGVQFVLRHVAAGSSERATVSDLELVDSVADRYSQITALGTGASTDSDVGEGLFCRGVASNGPGPDGIGVDFDHPKRLLLTERSMSSNAEAVAVATREMARRDFKSRQITATMPLHGQAVGGGARVLFACNTLARVIDEELEPTLDAVFLIYAASFRGSREGETTMLSLVPKGTRFVQ